MGTRVAACGSGWSELSLLALLVMVVLGLLLVTPTPNQDRTNQTIGLVSGSGNSGSDNTNGGDN